MTSKAISFFLLGMFFILLAISFDIIWLVLVGIYFILQIVKE